MKPRLSMPRSTALASTAGFVTIQFVTASALALVLFTAMANLVVFQYGRGVVRAALDEGVRAGARAPAAASECERRAAGVIGDLLGGRMGEGVVVRCAASADQVQAAAEVTFPGWSPMVPGWSFTARAVSVREPLG